MSKMYVVTNVEMGWDCVCGVFKSKKSLRYYLVPEDDLDDDCKIRKESPYYKASISTLKELIRNRPLVIHDVYSE